MRTCKVCGVSIEDKSKRAMFCSMKCYRRYPDNKSRARELNRTPERIAYHRAYKQTQEYKERWRARTIEYMWSYHRRQKSRDASALYHESSEYKSYHRAYKQTPEYKAYARGCYRSQRFNQFLGWLYAAGLPEAQRQQTSAGVSERTGTQG